MSFYPPKINDCFENPKNVGKARDANAVGTGASFVCGTILRLTLRIEPETKTILAAKFQTNGCGFTIAAAEALTKALVGRKLTELHGSNKEDLRQAIEAELGEFPASRIHCLEICFKAMQAAFADFRHVQVEEFAGEKALVCTCFGVSEETVERVIKANALETVEEVTDACNAGGGCGSCQFLIQELIDVHQRESFG